MIVLNNTPTTNAVVPPTKPKKKHSLTKTQADVVAVLKICINRWKYAARVVASCELRVAGGDDDDDDKSEGVARPFTVFFHIHISSLK